MQESRIRSWLAVSLILLVALAMTTLFFWNTPPSNKEMISMVLGALLAKLTDVYGYHFGSSASSRDKDATIQSLVAPAPVSDSSLVLRPGEEATATATAGGTVIERSEAP